MIVALAALVGAVTAGLFLFTLAASRQIERRYPPVGQLVDVGGGAIHVVETSPQGRERGAALLVQGASGNFADLDVALAERLAARGFRVFSVDRPGHGWSARLGGREASAPEWQAKILRAALARRGVDRAIVVVHSLAGALGLAMALDAPEFERGLVLLAPVSHPWPGGVSWYYPPAASPFWGPLFRWLVVLPAGLLDIPKSVGAVFAPNPIPPDYIERTRLPLTLRPWTFLANAEDVTALKGHVIALSTRYGEIAAPTAIVTGDKDGVVYAHIHSVGCQRDISGATLTVLEGVGHSPHFCAPERVILAILEVDRRAREAEAAPQAEVVSSKP
jgi:pimeloyl-ACP methyl ester carboxylesterase